jgi:hypothetical protein
MTNDQVAMTNEIGRFGGDYAMLGGACAMIYGRGCSSSGGRRRRTNAGWGEAAVDGVGSLLPLESLL